MGSLNISRALLIALACGVAAALTPLSAAGDDNDCALYLSGPGRTSAYDYSLNLLKGNFGYEGQHTCITYDAIDQAYLEARNRIVVSQPKGDWKAEDFASVGELILDISINLARRYGLTYEEIEKGLPLIDTSKTLIRDVCPPVFSHVECRAGKYRRLDGLCNNLQHPTWGSTMSPFQRLLGPLFSDGINAPRIAHTGRDLPLSRVVSRTMHPDEGFHDHAGTVMVIAWGQFMDHDYTLTGTPLDPINRNDPEECCKRPPHLKHPYCNEIRIPDDDYFYRLWNVKCIDFVRAFPSPRPGCRLGSRVPFNTLTGVIDGNTIYGVTDKFSRKLRTGFGGLLRMNPVFKEYGLKDLLPLKLDIPDEGCTRPNKNMYCFEAGEIRVNEQLVLTVMHTLMAREHNRVARALAHVNPHWGDETLFQEARRITVAQIQHITYNEFLPILLGKDVMEKFGLVLEKEGYWDGYDPAVNPDVIDAFASAAFRFGHSLLPTAVERWSKAHKFIASKRLSDLIRRPFDLYRAGVLDEYVMGLMNQVAQAMDDSITQEVTNHLFKKVGARFGMDLVSFNMQRGREFGIPGYMEFRKFCGLNGANSFQDLFGSMPNETVRKYESIFEHPIDVDLWSGGVSERPLPGSMLGPTFACVIATQFSYSRRGDRFWFELPNQPSSFTPEQLVEIRKARLARVICDNTDIIDTVQLYPMVLPDHELNPRVPCRSGILPSMDFSKWADSSPFHGDKPFVTDAYIPIQNETDKDAQQLNKTYANTNSTSKLTKTLLNDNKTNDVVSQNVETTTKVTPCETENCTENLQTCTECKNTTKESHGTDTVLKYVYKKDNKADNTKKPASHFKNSLKRKRRSTSGKASAPLIVNYETSHGPPIGPAFERQTSKNIEKPAANFNIETIHDNNPNKNSDEIVNRNIYKESDDNLSNIRRDEKSDESIEHEGNIRNNKTLLEDNSVEKSGFRDKNQSGEYSSESNEEDNERYRKDNSSEELSEEKEAPNNRYKEQNREPHNNNDDSRERSEFSSKEPHNDSDENYKDDRKGQYKEFEHNEEKGGHRREPHDSSESYENDKRNIPYKKHENSEERSEYTADKYRKTNSLHPESRGSNSHNDRSSQSEENNDSHEGKQPKSDYKRSTPLQDSNEGGEHSEESNKNSPIRDENRSDYSKPSEESSEHSKKGNVVENLSTKADLPSKNRTENQLYTNDKLSLIQSSEPESQEEETIIAIMKNKKRLNSPIKEVDLGDFNNYERIHINKAGAVEAIPDNYDDLSAPLITPLTTLQPVTVQESGKLLSKTDDTDSSSSVESNEENNRLVTIDDEEVKPVVEINSDKVQSLEENSKEALNSKSSEDTSLETFLGVKESDRIEDKEKIVVQPEGQTGGDVKQEFERIPLNYNHVKKEEEQNTDELPNSKPDPINILPPKEPERYDEHLNIKFDDISIKLPEIKLPEDILAYPYDESSYEKRDKKKKKKPKKENFFYYEEQEYNDDDSPRGPDHKNIQADVDEHSDYPSYYGNSHKKENYRQNKNNRDAHDDEEEEDLYEKFVRERFGKSGTFEKRSAKLTEPKSPSEDNAELFQALNSVLKKAENIEKEAQKSGDPNAGYIWTVEYAKPL